MAGTVILASKSEARARMLRAAGVDVEIWPASVDEAAVRESLAADHVAPPDAATALAELKGRAVTARLPDDALVLASDQLLVTDDGGWLEKPESMAAAKTQLMRLQGCRHRLITAAVAFRGGERIWHHVAEARLWLRQLDDAAIDRYLDAAGEQILACVGAYEIEGMGARLMARIEGDFFAIQGLPLLPVLEFLRVQGVIER